MAVERIAIVGAGPAGGRAAEALRGLGYPGEVLLLGDERAHLLPSGLAGREPIARQHGPHRLREQRIRRVDYPKTIHLGATECVDDELHRHAPVDAALAE